VLTLAWEGLVLSTGALLIWGLSWGGIRVGEHRNLSKPAPKANSGRVFYFENGRWYIYRNFAILVGWAFLMLVLIALCMLGFVRYAP
jgi:hypothetical protein